MAEGRRYGVQEPRDYRGEYLDESEARKAYEDDLNEQEASSTIVLRSPRWYNTESDSDDTELAMDQIRRRAATTVLIVEASLNDQETVGVLLLPVAGALHRDWLHIRENVASWSTRAASSRSEFVM